MTKKLRLAVMKVNSELNPIIVPEIQGMQVVVKRPINVISAFK